MLLSRSAERLSRCAPKPRFYSGGPPPWRPVSALDQYDDSESSDLIVCPKLTLPRLNQMG